VILGYFNAKILGIAALGVCVCVFSECCVGDEMKETREPQLSFSF